jgi:hypothetical protein
LSMRSRLTVRETLHQNYFSPGLILGIKLGAVKPGSTPGAYLPNEAH